MSVTINAETQNLIEQRMSRGGYSTADDLVRAALETLEQQQGIAKLNPAELETLYPDVRTKLAEGLAAAAAGRVVDGDAFFDELERDERARAGDRKTA